MTFADNALSCTLRGLHTLVPVAASPRSAIHSQRRTADLELSQEVLVRQDQLVTGRWQAGWHIDLDSSRNVLIVKQLHHMVPSGDGQ